MKENISALRISLYECNNPGATMIPFQPQKAKRYAWIPQTMGDQIWCLFEFDNKEDKEGWEQGLPENIKEWIDSQIIEPAEKFGWGGRDMNGFLRNDGILK